MVQWVQVNTSDYDASSLYQFIMLLTNLFMSHNIFACYKGTSEFLMPHLSHGTSYKQQIVTSEPWYKLNLETELADLLSSLSQRLEKHSHISLSGVKVSCLQICVIEVRLCFRIKALSILGLWLMLLFYPQNINEIWAV